MSDLEKVRNWLKEYPGIPEDFQIDFTSEIPGNAGLYPNGTVELSRAENVCGDLTIANRYNFGIYKVVEKPADVDTASTQNAEWVMNFQRWVQEQSVRREAPTFGNIDTDKEVFQAQNGQYYGDSESGVGVYMVTLSAQFKLFYEGGY